jgi:DNA-binding response OmpR family regulator/anti-sigma regulatory factor (Ser/Thr protein kinase)
MSKPLRVLIVEDARDDVDLLVRALERSGYHPSYEQVETAPAMRAALCREEWDVVVADYSLPGFSGPDALSVLKEQALDLPFIILSGQVSEEVAVEVMRLGAHDYIPKGKMTRLVPAIEREVREASARRARREAEAALQAAEGEKRRFYREVIRAVTHDKLHLVDETEIPTEGELELEMALDGVEAFPVMRGRVREIAQRAGMVPDQTEDLLLALGEAATNAHKHGVAGRCAVFIQPDAVTARVSDRGSGIHPDDLPGALFQPGFSTQPSLGMGYTLILELMDRVWLATGPAGTTLQLQKWLDPAKRQEQALLAFLERF